MPQDNSGHAMAEEAPLLSVRSPERQDEQESSRTSMVPTTVLRVVLVIGVVTLIAALGVSVSHASSPSASSDLAEERSKDAMHKSRHSFPATTAGSSTLTISVWNEVYAKQPNSVAQDATYRYHWDYVLEPGRENYIQVQSSSGVEDSIFTWTVEDSDISMTFQDSVDGCEGRKVSFTPTKADAGNAYGITIKEKDSTGRVLGTLRVSVVCKYVRREFRELVKQDRDNYFDALSIIYHVATTEGQTTYGGDYYGSDYFIRKHLGAMTLEGCTPWHDSPVFVTTHAAFNLELERTLRSIDESLSAHYWEYSIDSTEYGKEWASESPIFTADFFGSYQAVSSSSVTSYIADGRFSDLTFHSCPSDNVCPEKSIFGYMIDANNFEANPRLQRSSSVCGIPTISKLPGCQFVERALSSWDLYKFWDNIELRYHGDNHALIGGVMGCHYQAVDELSDYSHSSEVMRYAEDVALYLVAWGRTLFSYNSENMGTYSGVAQCPHDSDSCEEDVDCTCTLPKVIKVIEDGDLDIDYAVNVLRETDLFDDLSDAVGWAVQYDTEVDELTTDNWEYAFKGLSVDETKSLLIYMAKLAAYQARMILPYSLSLGSVNDPIFWAAHNSWERMWIVQRMTTTDSGNWTEWETSSTVTCEWARSADSTLPFWNLMRDDETSSKYYTNKDMVRMFQPENVRLPHIYNSLDWGHCAESVYDKADEDHANFRAALYSSLQRRRAQQYMSRVEQGYSDESKAALNEYYEVLFSDSTLDNYEDRPQY